MKKMKKQEVILPKAEAKAKKKGSVGVILFCLAVMAAAVAKGIQLDREEAEKAENEEIEE